MQISSISLLLLLAVPLAAQAPKVVRISGRVLDAAGAPVAAAMVRCMHRGLPADLQSDDVDRRELRCDENGVFRGELLAGREYSVWASWPTGATTVAEAVADGGFVELRAAPGTGPAQIPLVGLPAWQELAPLSFRALVGSANLDFVDVPLRDGVLELPSLPPMEVRIVEILDRTGRLVWAIAPDDAKERRLPPLAEVRMAVVDAHGAPLAGAMIQRHLRNYWYTQSATVPFAQRFRNLWPQVGVSNAAGWVQVRLPMPADGLAGLFALASKQGHGMCAGKQVGPGEGLVFELPGAGDVALQLQLGGQPYTGPVATVWRVGKGGGGGMPFSPALLQCDAGRVERPLLPSDAKLEQAWVQLSDALRSELETAVGAAPPRSFRLPDAKAALLGGVDPLLPESCRAVQVVSVAGTPATGATVVAAALQPRGRVQELFAARADRLGRVLIPDLGQAAQEQPPLLVAVTPQGWGMLRDDGSTRRLRVQLIARPELTGIVRDGNGEPVAGADIYAQVAVTGTAEPREHELPLPLVSSLLAREGAVGSDAAGRFRRALLPITGTVQLRATFGTEQAKASVDCDPAAALPEVELQLAAPDHRKR
ncbi:MAG: carboxypeptidase regulatory-like domain-containing protein [Planctomycetes bacterium]|nr:carboxypeptidase regulatory-like domain-containing protein [Planctomycetota bacterium]